MDWRDRRLWYGVGAVAAILVLLLLAWAAGWFGPASPPPQAPPQ